MNRKPIHIKIVFIVKNRQKGTNSSSIMMKQGWFNKISCKIVQSYHFLSIGKSYCKFVANHAILSAKNDRQFQSLRAQPLWQAKLFAMKVVKRTADGLWKTRIPTSHMSPKCIAAYLKCTVPVAIPISIYTSESHMHWHKPSGQGPLLLKLKCF